jgi:secreted trypsin-like serine protease
VDVITDNDSLSCGGTIIGARTILTAAHCLLSASSEVVGPTQVSVSVGALTTDFGFIDGADTTGCAESYLVSKIVLHPNFSPNLFDNDVAILTLNRAIDIQNKPCACQLCLEDNVPKTGDLCVVSGTGNQFTSDQSKT